MSVLAGTPTDCDAPFGAALVELGRSRPDLVVLSADLSRYTDVLPFADAFPQRFFQVGMAEQNMMGIAGGLAKVGLTPVAVTYGVFATRRAYDQVAMAMATGPSRGVVVAFLPGITTPFRATHQATDDLALARAIPGMTVVDPADATELRDALEAAVAHDGPVYLRGLRGRVPVVFDRDAHRLRLGATYRIRNGDDAGLVATGIGTRWALEAAAGLSARGIEASILHVPTLKPADDGAIAEFCSGFDEVATIENHSTVGGLGTVVCEAVARHGLGARVRTFGVPDRWADSGSVDFLRRRLGLDAETLAGAIEAAA